MLGLRRYAKITNINASTNFDANKKRVALKVLMFSAVATDGVTVNFAQASANNPNMSLSQPCPYDEIWLERHGSLVMEAFRVITTVNVSVIEIIDNEIDDVAPSGDPYRRRT